MSHPVRPPPRRVQPLKDLCQRALRANVHRIWRLGAVPHYLVSDALSHCDATQLARIERANPHITSDNEPLWRSLGAAKYPELRDLHARVAEGLAPAPSSWREEFCRLRRQGELRAQAIMERVRCKTVEAEQRRDARRIKVTRPVVHGRSAARAAREPSLMHDARVKARAHMQMLERPARPAGSPPASYSPPRSYSPQYLSSGSSGSPQSYSPPYVPDAAACTAGYSPSVRESPAKRPRPHASTSEPKRQKTSPRWP